MILCSKLTALVTILPLCHGHGPAASFLPPMSSALCLQPSGSHRSRILARATSIRCRPSLPLGVRCPPSTRPSPLSDRTSDRGRKNLNPLILRSKNHEPWPPARPKIVRRADDGVDGHSSITLQCSDGYEGCFGENWTDRGDRHRPRALWPPTAQPGPPSSRPGNPDTSAPTPLLGPSSAATANSPTGFTGRCQIRDSF